MAPPLDAARAAPKLTLTPEDAERGLVPRLQAAESDRNGPVLRGNVPSGPDAGPCLFLVGPEAAEAATSSSVEAFSSDEGWRHVLGRGCGHAVLNTDDPLHAEQRRQWAPSLTSAMIQLHWPAIERAIDRCIEQLRAGDGFDAYPTMRLLAFRAVGTTFAALPEAAIEPAFRAICVILDGQDFAHESRESYVARANAARAEFGRILLDVIATRRRNRAETATTLLDLLLDYPSFPDNPDPDDAIRSHLSVLLIAGHDTGATLYSRAAFVLAEHPEIADLLRRELAAAGWTHGKPLPVAELDRLPYLQRFMLEAGRLYPSLLNLPRVVVKETEIGGYRLLPGTRIALAAAATHLLERLHRDPLRFDLERYTGTDDPRSRPFRMLTFGGGSRICMGMRFAQLEFKAIFARLIAHLMLESAVEGPVPHAGFWAARPAAPLQIHSRAR
jgi:cytochrome P450